MVGLRPDYTFDRFVDTKSTIRARRACAAVAEWDPSAPRLLVLYGPPGTGKTHLLHATGHAALQRDPNARVLRATARDLATDLLKALRRDDLGMFENKYREFDLLLVDDIQDLAALQATQAQLTVHWQSWIDHGARIVLAGMCGRRVAESFDVRPHRSRVRHVGFRRVPVPDLRRIAQAWGWAQNTEPIPPRHLSRLIRRSSGDVRRVLGGLAQFEARTRLQDPRIE